MAILVKNAKIATMDAANPQAEAAVIVGGFFAYVGTEDGARAYLAERNESDVEILDAKGQFVLPGFNDSHMHYLHYAKAKKSAVNLTGCTSLQEVLERMKDGFANQYDKNSRAAYVSPCGYMGPGRQVTVNHVRRGTEQH